MHVGLPEAETLANWDGFWHTHTPIYIYIYQKKSVKKNFKTNCCDQVKGEK